MDYFEEREIRQAKTRRSIVIGGIALLVFIFFNVCFVRCTRVDSSEVGIKFNKLSLSEQGTLKASPVTGYVFFTVLSQQLFTHILLLSNVLITSRSL